MTKEASGFPAVEKIGLPHIALMEEEGLTKDQLPIDIKRKLQMMIMKMAAYTKSPSYAKLEALKKQSVTLSDLIQTEVLEKDLPATPDDNDGKPVGDGVAGVKPLKKDTPPAAGTPPGESEFKKIMDKDKRIYADDLKKLMGKKSLDDSEEFEGVALLRSVAFYYPVKKE